jgi:DNA repair protein RadC
VFWLNSANKVVGYEVVSEDILNSSLTHPREVFRGAIVATAASVILAHNHPSDNIEPSQEDISITRQLVESGKILGIPVHDHIIFAGNSYTSLAERGLV